MAATHKGRPETAARPGGPAAVGAAPKPGGSPASAGGEAPPSSLHLSPRRLCTAPLSSPGSPRGVQASLGVAASGARQGARSSPFPLSRPHAGPVTARLSEPTNERAPPGRGRAADGRYPTGPAAAREAPSPRRWWLRRDAPRVAATAAAAGRFRGATSVGGPAAAGGRGQGREGRAARPGGGVEAAPPTAAAKGAWAGSWAGPGGTRRAGLRVRRGALAFQKPPVCTCTFGSQRVPPASRRGPSRPCSSKALSGPSRDLTLFLRGR